MRIKNIRKLKDGKLYMQEKGEIDREEEGIVCRIQEKQN